MPQPMLNPRPPSEGIMHGQIVFDPNYFMAPQVKTENTFNDVLDKIHGLSHLSQSVSRQAGILHYPGAGKRRDARNSGTYDMKTMLYGHESGSGSGGSGGDKNSYGQQMPNGAIRFSPTVI